MEAKIVATKAELNDAFSVRHKVFVDEQKVPEDLEIDEYEEEATHVVLYHNGTPIGAGRYRHVDDYVKVERICVLPSYRKTGAGKLIMDTIEKNARKKLVLNAQIGAEGFYKKLHYKTRSDQFMDAGIPHVKMTKTLD